VSTRRMWRVVCSALFALASSPPLSTRPNPQQVMPMNPFKLLIRPIRRALVDWLDERALRLPADKRAEIAAKLGVDISVVEAVEAAIREWVIARLR